MFRKTPKLEIQASTFYLYVCGIKAIVLARAVSKATGAEIINQLGGGDAA
jgi:hypothetical protein